MGTFRPDESGNEFHRREVVAADLAQMAAIGTVAEKAVFVVHKHAS